MHSAPEKLRSENEFLRNFTGRDGYWSGHGVR